MKKHFLLFALLYVSLAGRAGDRPLSLSGTYLVGNSQPVYKKLTNVAAALNNAGNTITGDVIFELDSDYDGATGETFPITFNQFNSVGGNWTVTIRPKAGVSMRTTAGDPGGNALIRLNGTDRLILDGRAGGSGGIAWLLRNTRTSSPGSTLQLSGDAQNNTLTWLQLEGQTTNGIVNLGGVGPGGQGNDNNIISYCDIRDRSDVTTVTPRTGIMSGGTTGDTAGFNSGNTIAYNHIFNFYANDNSSFGIFLNDGTTATLIKGNSFYQTRSFTGATGNTVMHAVYIAEETTANTVVSDNFIGGSAPECSGAPFTLAGASVTFRSICFIGNDIGDGDGAGNKVDHNTIRNFAINSGTFGGLTMLFRGIDIVDGQVDVTDNIIGSSDGNDDISLTVGSASMAIACTIINFETIAGGSVTGNKIGGFTVTGAGTSVGTFTAIWASISPQRAFILNVNDNIIGSTTVSDNIRMLSETTPFNFTGIQASVSRSGSAVNCKNNTVSGISLAYKGASTAVTIAPLRAQGSPSLIENNLVSDISSASLTPSGSINFAGIFGNFTSYTIRNNTIRRLRLTGTEPMNGTSSNVSTICGISLSTGSSPTVSQVYNNKIYDLTSTNNLGASSATILLGMDIRLLATIYNNQIALTNGTNTNNCEVGGIRVSGTPTYNIFHNSIYLGGHNGAASNAGMSSVITRSGNSTKINLRNNLLVNGRTGGSGIHYLFYNFAPSSPATNWPVTASDYNVLVTTNLGKTGKWGSGAIATDLDSAQWKTTGGDVHSSYYTVSQIAPSDLFTDTATADLSIKESSRGYVAGRGTGGTAITADYAGTARSTSLPSAGAYEYEYLLSALEGLTVSSGTLTPVFDMLTTSYADTVTVSSITVTPQVLHAGSTITVNGTAVASGNASNPLTLNAGANTITIVVATPGAYPMTYTITVVRNINTPSLAGDYLVGSSQPVYKKLTDVANALNTLNVTGNVVFELDSDYDGTIGETFPVTFNQFNAVGGDWTVTIRPKAGVSLRTTAGNSGSANQLITFNGADHLILDGRPGGAGSNIGWLIRNTRNAPSTTIYLLNDAQDNVLTWLQLEGQGASITSAIVYLGTTNGTQGNDNNTISYCYLRSRTDVATTYLGTAILSYSTVTDTARFNSGNIITHNRITDFFYDKNISTGVYLYYGTTGATVTHNSFYHTRSFAGTNTSLSGVYSLVVSEPALSNTVISDNFMGGSAPECGGAPFSLAGPNVLYRGIYFSTPVDAPGTGNLIDHNTISNISVNSDVVVSGDIFSGIWIGGRQVDITNNTIGSTDRNDAIMLTTGNGTEYFTFYGISFASVTKGSITGNKVGGITVTTPPGMTGPCYFYGILAAFTPVSPITFNVSDNLVGSTTVSNSIRSVSEDMPFHYQGIMANIYHTGATVNCKNNTVSGVLLPYKGILEAPDIYAIRLVGTATAVIDSNLVSDISSASLMPTSSITFAGLSFNGGTSSATVRNNTIRRLHLTGTELMNGTSSDVSVVCGISLSSGSASQVYNNKIYDFTSTNNLGASSATILLGMDIRHQATIYNNQVALTNGINTNNCEVGGIRVSSSALVNLFHNSIYVGGNNGSGSNTGISAAVTRSGNFTKIYLRNNLLVNGRKGGNGSHYLFYNFASSSPATNWPVTTSDYNVLITTNLVKTGKWGSGASAVDLDSAQWKTTGGDVHSSFYTVSQIAPSALFTDTATADLSIKENSRGYVAGRGTSGTGIAADVAGTTRSAAFPSAGAYEYLLSALQGLTISSGTLSPAFGVFTTSYADTVKSTVGSITVTPQALHAGSTITVNGTAVASGAASDPIALNVGTNIITIVVTTPGASPMTYTVTVVSIVAVNTAPVITSYEGNIVVAMQVPENTIAAATVTATDADAGATLVYSLAGGEDEGRFTVNSATGLLSFLTAPDFEQPGDANGDNNYIVTVQVSDGEFTATQRFKLKITDANDHAPVITSYNGDAAVTLRVEENTTAILATVKATDADKNSTIMYSLVNEEDAAKFTVNSAAGTLSFITSPDFDQPGDVDGDNNYIVTVKASDGDSSVTQRFKIKVTGLNDNAPVFTSHNGEAAVNLELPENTPIVTTVSATDGDRTPVTYSILDGDDGALFTINSSGQLSFITAPDFEHPADGNRDNIYSVSVKASDGSLADIQRFTIKITDLNDNLPRVAMTVRMPENTTEVTDLEATDTDAGSTFTLAILNEEDGMLFSISAGMLVFNTAPDFEQPADADADNTYLVSIKITDGDFAFVLRLKVKVMNVEESAGRSAGVTAKGPAVSVQEKATPELKEETEAGKYVRAYPNPVTGKRFTLRVGGLAAGRYMLEIYTASGQLAYRQRLDHAGKTVNYPIQLPTGLLRGVYLLRLTGTNTRHIEKLVID